MTWTDALDTYLESKRGDDRPRHSDGFACTVTDCAMNHHYCDETHCDCAVINADLLMAGSA